MAQPGPPILNSRDAIGSQAMQNPMSVGQNSSDPANMWHQFFGPPIGEVKTNPYDKYQYETFTLPDAYRGKNIFLRDTIEGFIETNNTWYTTACLPTQITDQLHISWNAWHFDQALASVVPEEGISRLITSSRKANEDHTIRHGLAFTLEHGFMNTEEGRKQYLLNIQQIAQAVQETNNYDVLSSLLNCSDYEREWEKRHSIIRSPWTEIGRREVMEFAIVQKDPRGLEILHEKYKKRMQRYGSTPNMWIWPPGLALYAAFNPTVSDYDKTSASVTLNTTEEALGSFRGVNVFETREFDVRNGELPINLLERRVQIGEHYYMRDHSPNTEGAAEDYDPEIARSIFIYNEAKDDFCKISYKTALNRALDTIMGRDDAQDNQSDYRLGDGLRHFNLLGDQCPKNTLFTYKASEFSDNDDHEWAEFCGQIESKHWDNDAVRRFVFTAKAYINREPDTPANEGVGGGKNAALKNLAGASGQFFGSDDNMDPGYIPFTFAEADALEAEAVYGSATVDPTSRGAVPAKGDMRNISTPLRTSVYGNLGPTFFALVTPRDEIGWTVASNFQSLNAALQKYTGTVEDNLQTMGLAGVISDDKLQDASALQALFDSGATLRKSDLANYASTKAFQTFRGKVTGKKVLALLTTDETIEVTDKIYADVTGGNDERWEVPDNLYVVLHDGSDRGGEAQKIKDNDTVIKSLKKIYRGDGVNRASVVARINSRFAVIEEKRAPTSVGSKRANNSTWSNRGSKKRGVMDFAEVGTAYTQLTGGNGGAPQRQGDIDLMNTHNLRVGKEAQGFKINGKIEKFIYLLRQYQNRLDRQILWCLWFSGITRKFFNFCTENRIAIPWDVMIARPNMTYDMATCILMKGGSETGATFQGHSDFQLGDDVQSKIHYGNYTYYSKALVTNPKNILLARNIFATGYVRGNDCEWVETEADRNSGQRNGKVKAGSMYAFLVPANQHKKPNPLRLFAEEDDGYGNKFGRQMVGGNLYAHIYGHNQQTSSEDFETIGTRNDQNDVTYQGHTFWWKTHRENINNHSRGSYTGVTINTGHWGPKVYAGCGRVRNGEEVYLKDISYEPEVY